MPNWQGIILKLLKSKVKPKCTTKPKPYISKSSSDSLARFLISSAKKRDGLDVLNREEGVSGARMA